MRSIKSGTIITLISGFIFLLTQCSTAEVQNKKDLDENMIDMMMYHDNLGMYLRTADADYAKWLLEGMDSTLQVISVKFEKHRKLDDPFKKYYKKLLVPPIKGIRRALSHNDFSAAILSYRQLTKNCNSCHIDHDIEKTVIDWSDPAIH